MVERWKEEGQEVEKILSYNDLTLLIFRCRVQHSSTLRRQFGHSAIRDQSGDWGPQGSKPQTFKRDTPQSPFEKRMHRARWVRQSRPRSPPLHSHIQFCISSNSSPNLLHAFDRCGRGNRESAKFSRLRIFPSPLLARMLHRVA